MAWIDESALFYRIDSTCDFDELRRLACERPAETGELAWRWLTTRNLLSSIMLCPQLLRVLRQINGSSATEARVLAAWPTLPVEWGRTNIGFAAVNAEAVPPAFLEKLFFAPGSGARERHLLLLGLYQQRNPDPSLLVRLLPHLIPYDNDERRQRNLDRFVAGCRTEFLPPEPKA